MHLLPKNMMEVDGGNLFDITQALWTAGAAYLVTEKSERFRRDATKGFIIAMTDAVTVHVDRALQIEHSISWEMSRYRLCQLMVNRNVFCVMDLLVYPAKHLPCLPNH